MPPLPRLDPVRRQSRGRRPRPDPSGQAPPGPLWVGQGPRGFYLRPRLRRRAFNRHGDGSWFSPGRLVAGGEGSNRCACGRVVLSEDRVPARQRQTQGGPSSQAANRLADHRHDRLGNRARRHLCQVGLCPQRVIAATGIGILLEIQHRHFRSGHNPGCKEQAPCESCCPRSSDTPFRWRTPWWMKIDRDHQSWPQIPGALAQSRPCSGRNARGCGEAEA